jgi:hypothetical protein
MTDNPVKFRVPIRIGMVVMRSNMDSLLASIYPRPTPAFRKKFAAKRDRIRISGAKRRAICLAEEYAKNERSALSKVTIRSLFRSLEALRRAADRPSRRDVHWKERFLTEAYSLSLRWCKERRSFSMMLGTAIIYGITIKGDPDPIEVLIHATAPFLALSERKSMIEALLHAKDNSVPCDQLATFLKHEL